MSEQEPLPCPNWAKHWTVDEVAEILPGMLASRAYELLWSFVNDDPINPRPTLDQVWAKLTVAHQQAIVDGYAKEYGENRR